MIQIEIYTKKNCPYCQRAKSLLTKKSLSFKEIPIDSGILQNDKKYRIEMYQRSNRITVPQIFINNQHIGGSDDLYLFSEKGKLDQLITSSLYQ